MTARLIPLSPRDVADRLRSKRALLIDIREPDEFARRHVKGAISQPLSALEAAHLAIEPGKDVVFTCRSGMRTQANCDRLAAATVAGEVLVMEGGVDAWAAAGLPVETDRKAPLEVMRQVQITAGLLVLSGVILSLVVHPALIAISAFVGAGLTFAGATGWCGMASLLQLAPWNRPAKA
jgi:rhodanese-related sulfurtransferase